MKGTVLASLCLLAASPALASLLDGDSTKQMPLLAHDSPWAEEMPLARLDIGALSEREREGVRSLLLDMQVDVWRQTTTSVDFYTSRSTYDRISNLIGRPARLTTLNADMAALIASSSMSSTPLSASLAGAPGSGRSSVSLDDPFHDAYHSVADIYTFGDKLVHAYNNARLGDGKLHMESFVLGKTYEDREMKGFRVKYVPPHKKKTPPRPTEPLPTDTATMTSPAPEPTLAPEPTESGSGAQLLSDPVTPPSGWEALQDSWQEVEESMDQMEEWLSEELEAWQAAAEDVVGQWAKRSFGKSGKNSMGARSSKGKKGQKGKKGKKRKHGKHGKKGKHGNKGKELVEREFVIQSGSHAREWVGPSSAIYFIHSILDAATADHESEEATLLRSFTFTVIPTINPDGYEYSKQHRLWRKNRQQVGSDICQGIDLNTNWGYQWKAPDTTSACSDAYQGSYAFEAYETRAVADYLANGTQWKHGKREPEKVRKVRAFIDLHSYGQLFMYPFAYSCDAFPPDAEMLLEAGLGVAKAMRNDHGETYQSGQACELTYRAAGDAIDYAYGEADIRWSYSAELRDTGTYGFMLPPHLIRPTADEISTGLVHLAKFIYNVEVVEHQ